MQVRGKANRGGHRAGVRDRGRGRRERAPAPREHRWAEGRSARRSSSSASASLRRGCRRAGSECASTRAMRSRSGCLWTPRRGGGASSRASIRPAASTARLIHTNDCLFERGARRDRHAWIGDGFIGEKVFARLLARPELRAVAGASRCRGDPEKDATNIARLKLYRSECPRSHISSDSPDFGCSPDLTALR